MDKIDKFLTHKVWIIVIIAIVLYLGLGVQVALIVTVMILLTWGLLASGNPEDVIGIIYYRDGRIQRTEVFKRYSQFETWREDTYRQYGHLISYITYELYFEEEK